MQLYPNPVEIDLAALAQNFDQVRGLLQPSTRIMGVVKSDAYGHGLLPVSRALVKRGVDCLGVAHLSEALELRGDGILLPIFILCGIRSKAEAARVLAEDLTPAVYDLDAVEMLAAACSPGEKKVRVLVKVDTGMGRLGIDPAEVGPFLRRLTAFKGICPAGLMSHLACADEPVPDFTRSQIRKFKAALDAGRDMGLDLSLNSLAASAGIMGYKDAHFDMVRPGIMLYGGSPDPEYRSSVPLKPVMHLKGRVLQIRDCPDRTPVSYGRTYYTAGPRRIAILSAGYGDGIPRGESNRGKVLLRGRKAPIVGRVCMNMLMCDVTGFEAISPGDEAVFLGTQGHETLSGDEVAAWAQTIAYEVFCSIGQGRDRKYIP